MGVSRRAAPWRPALVGSGAAAQARTAGLSGAKWSYQLRRWSNQLRKWSNHFKRADGAVLLAAVALVVGLKAAFSSAAPEAYRWLLTPTTVAVSWLTGIEFTWEAGVGYANFPLLYWIVPACSGLTFFVAATGALVTLLAVGRRTNLQRAAWFVASVGIALGATLVANTMRLVAALTIHREHLRVAGLDRAELHRLLGLVVYLVALIALVELARRRASGASLKAPLLVALGWYLAVTLVIPALRGHVSSREFFVHAAWVLGGVVAVLALHASVGRALRRSTSLCADLDGQ